MTIEHLYNDVCTIAGEFEVTVTLSKTLAEIWLKGKQKTQLTNEIKRFNPTVKSYKSGSTIVLSFN